VPGRLVEQHRRAAERRRDLHALRGGLRLGHARRRNEHVHGLCGGHVVRGRRGILLAVRRRHLLDD